MYSVQANGDDHSLVIHIVQASDEIMQKGDDYYKRALTRMIPSLEQM